jgi:hypothetical protein
VAPGIESLRATLRAAEPQSASLGAGCRHAAEDREAFRGALSSVFDVDVTLLYSLEMGVTLDLFNFFFVYFAENFAPCPVKSRSTCPRRSLHWRPPRGLRRACA